MIAGSTPLLQSRAGLKKTIWSASGLSPSVLAILGIAVCIKLSVTVNFMHNDVVGGQLSAIPRFSKKSKTVHWNKLFNYFV